MSDQQFIDKSVALRLSIFAGSDGGRLSFIFDNGESDYEPIQHPWMTTGSLSDALLRMRQLLSTWSDKYADLSAGESSDKMSLGGELLKDLWHELAISGRNLYNDLFDLPTRGREELADAGDKI